MNKIDNNDLKKFDYKSFFYFGFILNCAGIAITIGSRNPAFLGVMAFGIILMLNSLANKDKWNVKNEKGKKL
jgi:hypothetical protein